MMSVLFGGMVLFSLVTALFQGNMAQLSEAVLAESSSAVQLVIRLLGGLCLWSGVMEVAEQSGVTARLSAAFSPVTRLLFRGLDPDSPAMRAIAMNMTANLLGLGNAATPLGLTAMQQLERQERPGRRASRNMILFVVLNTASLQLIPTTTAMLRLQSGSAAPMEILPAVWLASAASVLAGVLLAAILERLGGRR